MSYTKNDIFFVNYTLFFPEPNYVIYCLLLLRAITEPNFNVIQGAYSLPSSNHLCSMHNQLKYIFQNLLSIRSNWKIVGSKFLGKLKSDGNLAIKRKLLLSSSFVILRQLTKIHKNRDHKLFFKKNFNTWNKAYSEEWMSRMNLK